MNPKVDVVVVTYNRLELLKKCIHSIVKQDYFVNKIIVVDNNSTDNTYNYLKNISKKYDFIQPLHFSKNLGGAGGFYEGMKFFIEKSNGDYVWIMDDDTIPQTSALKKMVEKIKYIPKLGFLTSNVRWKNNAPALMNVQEPYQIWNQFADKGLIKVNYASFVSILFPRKVIMDVGLPIKEFFIWGDDVEYTRRIDTAGYMGFTVIDSLVTHEIKNNIGSNIILEEDENRIKRYYYARRNTIFTMKNRYGKKDYFKWIINSLIFEPIRIIRFSKDRKLLRLKSSLKGTISGFFFNPKVIVPKNKESKNFGKK